MALSWKQKFAVLIAATFVGLAIALAASLSGLSKVSEAYEARGQARSYQTASLSLMNDWLNSDRLSENLTPDLVGTFQTQLDSLETQATELTTSAEKLSEASIDESAEEIRDAVNQYTDLRREWLGLSQTLGLTNSDGLKAKMAGTPSPCSVTSM